MLTRRSLLASLPAILGSIGLSSWLSPHLAPPTTALASPFQAGSLGIAAITDNRSSYPNSSVPTYGKLEITFQITNSVASNLQFPYDPSPPTGIVPGVGITVNAQFSPDNFQTTYSQPAFYYQDFTRQQINSTDWIYPTSNYSWKVRWAPPQAGTWQYRLTAQDASGSTTSSPVAFTVVDSGNHGFIRAAKADRRYFEFADGTYFPGLGYNMNYDNVSWHNPIQDNTANFQLMGQNGIQLVRHWLSQWSIWGSYEPIWGSIVRGSDYTSLMVPIPPASGGPPAGAVPSGSNAVMQLQWSVNLSAWAGTPAMTLGLYKDLIPCKPNTSYHLKIRYFIPVTLGGPAIAGQPYGFVAKFGPFLQGSQYARPSDDWRAGQECSYPAALTNQVNPGANVVPVTPYVSASTASYQTLEADFTTDSNCAQVGNNYLRYLYLALENVTGNVSGQDGGVYVDQVSIQENLGGGQLGPNIVSQWWMSHCSYFDQWYSYKFDQVLTLAEENGISFKLVALEKLDFIQNSYDFSGNPVASTGGSTCANFYGNGTTLTYVRWLQQAYWRYLQARWGYSPSIHSWELCNEAAQGNTNGWALAQAFGAYMHQFAPVDHLVTTSLDQYFPLAFWKGSSYPDIDYADIHDYTETDSAVNPAYFDDSALATVHESLSYGATTAGGAGKPIVRGETGFVTSGSGNPSSIIVADSQGVWLHKFIWGQINSAGLIECYWYDLPHLHDRKYADNTYDHRPLFGPYYTFIKDLPLNNGRYQDLQATVSNPNLRVWGQKDLTGGKAHLWIDNATDTWNNLVNNPSAVVPQSGTVTFQLSPNTIYDLEQYDPYTGVSTAAGSITTDGSGSLNLSVTNLASDLAYRIASLPYSATVPILK